MINYQVIRGGFSMAYSEAQKKAVKKYNEKSYDEIKVRVKKGNKEPAGICYSYIAIGTSK